MLPVGREVLLALDRSRVGSSRLYLRGEARFR
jgi:hypothetical protein